MTTKELQQQTVHLYKTAGAHMDQFKLLLAAKDDPIQFMRVLLNNHYWCLSNGIYTADSLLQWDLEILNRAGLATQAFTPVDFNNPAEIGGKLWKPLNEGATKENIGGLLVDNDEAIKLGVPEINTLGLLAGASRQFGLYSGCFGWVLRGCGNNLFMPAAGLRNNTSGALETVGSYAYYWSSTRHSNAYHSYTLYFDYGGTVNPSYYGNRSFGFSVRCVQE